MENNNEEEVLKLYSQKSYCNCSLFWGAACGRGSHTEKTV